MNKTRRIQLLRGKEWVLALVIMENETFHTRGTFSFGYETSSERYKRGLIRSNDNRVFNRILLPDYFAKFQIHHDWENGGICYLLTRKEHILLHRKEKER